MIRHRLACVALLVGLWSNAGAADDVAVLQGLDKITGRITQFGIGVGQTVRFGTLQITIRRCYKRPPEESPEKVAFLEISETRPDEPAKELFTGWMFASSPAVSSLEHAIYDVWIVDCRKASSSD